MPGGINNSSRQISIQSTKHPPFPSTSDMCPNFPGVWELKVLLNKTIPYVKRIELTEALIRFMTIKTSPFSAPLPVYLQYT